jgi:CubicO group peptidase (beta-lactamase class C family)
MKQPYLASIFFFTILTLLGCDTSTPVPSPTLPPSSGQSNYAFFVGDYIDSLMTTHQIPGLAVGMIRDGQVDWDQAYGFANLEQSRLVDPSTRFRMGPSAQIITTTAVLQMCQSENLSLDADIRDLLPFPLTHPVFPNAGISLRMLLSHVSGLADRTAVIDTLYQAGDPQMRLRGFLENYFSPDGVYYDLDNFSDDRPGKVYTYARVNLALTAYVVEVMTGIDFDLYCKTRLFQQLGYSSVSWFLNDLSLEQLAVPYRLQGDNPVAQARIGSPIYPSGQLRISLNYLNRFWQAMITGGSYNGQTLLNQTLLNEMQTVSYPAANPQQALGWRYDTLDNRPLLGLRGSELGMSARLYAETGKQQGVIILSNGDWYEPALDSLTVRLLMAADSLSR